MRPVVLLATATALSLWFLQDAFTFSLYPADPVTGRRRGCYTDVETALGLKSPSIVRYVEGAIPVVLLLATLVVAVRGRSSPTDPASADHHRTKKRKAPVEGGGPVGCGCGFILGLMSGLGVFLGSRDWEVWLILALSLVTALLGWVFGDRFFEKVLEGDGDGKPLRYWRF